MTVEFSHNLQQDKPVICMPLTINLHILQQVLFPLQQFWLILK